MTGRTENNQISAEEFYQACVKNGISYFCGVPDTLLSPLGLLIEQQAPESHDVAVNEGSAVGMAIGHHIATSELPLVYMQNSGLGNAINPLTSLADSAVMGIPMILVIGWRGQPGKKDEPQHQKQGQITIPLLETLEIPHIILARDSTEMIKQINKITEEAKKSNQPQAIIIEADTIKPGNKPGATESRYPLSREEAIGYIVESLDSSDAVVATTGKTSRELFELRNKRYHGNHNQDLLIVGGMGHASTIALNIARRKLDKKVYCIDGDGAILMHMGGLAAIGQSSLKNFYHVVINNGAHESVGGQKTLAFDIDLIKIAEACGYARTYYVHKPSLLKNVLTATKELTGPIFIEVRVNISSRRDLARPDTPPKQNKKLFMDYL